MEGSHRKVYLPTINPDKYEKTNHLLLVLITNILFISAQKISKTELKDKIAGAWIGQMVGNIYGLPFENKFVDEPAPESRFPFGYTKNIDKLQKV